MSELQFFAVTPKNPLPLPVPASASTLDDLYTELSIGVYSSLRTFQHNKFLWLEDHITRTVSSMRRLGWTYTLDAEKLRQALHQVCTAFPKEEMRVRFDILAEPAMQLGSDSRVLIGLMAFAPYPDSLYQMGIEVGLAAGLTRDDPLAKTADFVNARKSFTANAPKMHERLLLDEQNRILEGMSSNFYGVLDGVLYTAKEGVLGGITLRIVLQLAEELGIPVVREALPVDKIAQLDEAAISSSSRALVPVVKIEGQLIGNGYPGPICQRLIRAYNTFVAQEVKTATT